MPRSNRVTLTASDSITQRKPGTGPLMTSISGGLRSSSLPCGFFTIISDCRVSRSSSSVWPTSSAQSNISSSVIVRAFELVNSRSVSAPFCAFSVQVAVRSYETSLGL